MKTRVSVQELQLRPVSFFYQNGRRVSGTSWWCVSALITLIDTESTAHSSFTRVEQNSGRKVNYVCLFFVRVQLSIPEIPMKISLILYF